MNLNEGKKYTDLSYLYSISKGNTGFVQKMLRTFIEQANADVKKLKSALDMEDWDTIFLIAHKIKPSLQFVGLSLLHADILSLEVLAKQKGNAQKAAEVISVISNVISIAIEEIKEELIVFEN
jgi:HPt (histidine-containing phosphotransfer) domain-containing protein